MYTASSDVQPLNAEEPMLVTLYGIVTLVSEEQLENAEEAMRFPPATTTVFRDEGTEEL